MSKRTNAMLDIKKGKNLERSLSAFAEELSAVYGSSAILNLSMNYANYFVNSKEKETDRSFAGLGDKINALIKSTIVEGNVSKKSIEEIESIREEVHSKTLTMYFPENFLIKSMMVKNLILMMKPEKSLHIFLKMMTI